MVPAAMLSPNGVALFRCGVAHLKIYFSGLVTAPLLGRRIDIALAEQFDADYERVRLGLLEMFRTAACLKLEDIVGAWPEKHSCKFETREYAKEKCLENMRTVSAAGRRFSERMPASLPGSKRVTIAPLREEPDVDGKRPKVGRDRSEKERRAHGDFGVMWCNACLKNGHPASSTDEALCA